MWYVWKWGSYRSKKETEEADTPASHSYRSPKAAASSLASVDPGRAQNLCCGLITFQAKHVSFPRLASSTPLFQGRIKALENVCPWFGWAGVSVVLSEYRTAEEEDDQTKNLPACCCRLHLSETEGKGQDAERVAVRQGTQPEIQRLAESLSFRFVRNCLGERNIFTRDVKQEGLREAWREAQEWAQPAAVIGSGRGLPSSTRVKLFLLSLSLKKLLCIWMCTCVCVHVFAKVTCLTSDLTMCLWQIQCKN